MLRNKKIINHIKLDSIDNIFAKKLSKKLIEHNFTSNYLLKIFGKEVTRHINISNMEIDYLRRQILYKNKNLRVLVDLFLLKMPVSYKDVDYLLGKDLLLLLLDNKILFYSDQNNICANICITPISSKYFINDADLFTENSGHVIQIVMEQPYLIKAVKLFASEKLKEIKGNILDLCTGSGIIGQSICPKGWKLIGVDINPRAISYAKFNGLLNNLDTNYKILNVVTEKNNGEYDIITANPPYNSLVQNNDNHEDITLHAGIAGNIVPDACVMHAKNTLKNGGYFFMCGIMLFNDLIPANKTITSLSKEGTVIVIHQAISKVNSWEGMRLMHSSQPNFDKIKDGQFEKIYEDNNWFTDVGWAILIYKKAGKKGLFSVYNHPTDAILFSEECINKCQEILS